VTSFNRYHVAFPAGRMRSLSESGDPQLLAAVRELQLAGAGPSGLADAVARSHVLGGVVQGGGGVTGQPGSNLTGAHRAAAAANVAAADAAADEVVDISSDEANVTSDDAAAGSNGEDGSRENPYTL
jgi:hypothetical protein